ncbi:response regulator [Geitlerinema sp. CS-897]|nr:response regulator [Geitlerinema sp. CS-897]
MSVSILLVDDLDHWRDILRALLEDCLREYEVEIMECSRFDNALKLIQARKHKFDLAILDLRLVEDSSSNIQGFSLLITIKKISPATKVVLMTAYHQPVEGQENEADLFIKKVPDTGMFNVIEFQEKIRNLLLTDC